MDERVRCDPEPTVGRDRASAAIEFDVADATGVGTSMEGEGGERRRVAWALVEAVWCAEAGHACSIREVAQWRPEKQRTVVYAIDQRPSSIGARHRRRSLPEPATIAAVVHGEHVIEGEPVAHSRRHVLPLQGASAGRRH